MHLETAVLGWVVISEKGSRKIIEVLRLNNKGQLKGKKKKKKREKNEEEKRKGKWELRKAIELICIYIRGAFRNGRFVLILFRVNT